jgi:outer membrane protein assembly factor BamB
MNTHRNLRSLTATCLAWATLVFPALADGLIATPEPGWPQWRGPRRDGISLETGLLRAWPDGGPKLAWKVDGLGQGWSSPIITGGRLYITGDVDERLVVFCFDLAGKLLWRATNGAAWSGSFPGSRAACVYSAGKLYHLNAHGRLACLDAASGREQWTLDVLDRFDAKNLTWALSECLLVDGPRVIVTPGGRETLMAALDKNTGQVVWTTDPLPDENASYASPILFVDGGRRLIANCSSKHGIGVDADSGRLLWTVSLNNRYDTHVATPVYGSGAVFYVTAYTDRGKLYRLRHNGPAVTADYAWTSPMDNVTGGAVLVDNVLYSSGYSKPRHWFAIDWQTGQTRFEQKELSSGAAICAEGRLYCLEENGTMNLVELAPDALQPAGRFRLTERRVRDAWTHPVLLDGRLYLRYHDTLWCYDVRRTGEK